MEAPEPAFRIFPTQVPCYLNPILPGKSGFLLGVKLFLLPPKILASCQLTVRLPSSDEETWCWRQGRLLQWQTQEGAWKGPGPKGHTKAPHPQCIWAPEDSTELVSAAWRAPGVWSWYTWCLTYLDVVTFPGSFLCLSGADHKARGERALCACLAFLYKVAECCWNHLDERCHPIINSYYSFYCLVRVLMLAFTCPYVSV